MYLVIRGTPYHILRYRGGKGTAYLLIRENGIKIQALVRRRDRIIV